MVGNKAVGLLAVILVSATLPSAARAQRNYEEYAAYCRAHGGNPSPNPARCDPPPSGGASSSDTGAGDEAEARAREAADAAEADRARRERLAEEKRRKDAEFIRNRDAAAGTLKGSIGTSVSPNDGGLKGSSSVDTGLRELRGSERVGRDGPQTAWKQLHCAAALSGYAMTALSKLTETFHDPDYQEFSFLANQAADALNGQTLRVECPAAPPFPDMNGRAVELDQVKESEKKILSRAVAVAGRIKQRLDRPAASSAEPPQTAAAPPRTAPGAPQTPRETPEEKMRRVQRELNAANSQPITGRTKQEIDQQEKDRKELATLILANNGVINGQFESVAVHLGDAAPARTTRPPVSAPPPPRR
jgi:hypothetical protein